MEHTILQHCNGFTPIIDIVANDLGFMTAAVYGVHWRYCQMRHGVSKASMQSIANRLGISKRTARRHTHKLVEHGYLHDLTPNRRHAAHAYRDTGRVIIEALIEARLADQPRSDRESDLHQSGSDTESDHVGHKVSPGQTESQSRSDRESVKDSIKKHHAKKANETLSSLWSAIQRTLQNLMTPSTFNTHFATGQPVALHGSTLVVAMANPRSLDAIDRLNGHIIRAVNAQHQIDLVFIPPET